jgi:hypothetical protein
MSNLFLRVTCHQCDRTGDALAIRGILQQENPPLPQFVLVGPDDGFSGLLAWCTLCPLLPPAVTQIQGDGDPVPFDAMPELLMLPLTTLGRAIDLMKAGGGSHIGKSYFVELVQQLKSRS